MTDIIDNGSTGVVSFPTSINDPVAICAQCVPGNWPQLSNKEKTKDAQFTVL